MSGYFYIQLGVNQCNIETDSCALFPSLDPSGVPSAPIYLGGNGVIQQNPNPQSGGSSGSATLWIILVIVALIVGAGVYFYLKKKKSKK